MIHEAHTTKDLTPKQATIWGQYLDGTSEHRIAISVGMKPAEVMQEILKIKRGMSESVRPLKQSNEGK